MRPKILALGSAVFWAVSLASAVSGQQLPALDESRTRPPNPTLMTKAAITAGAASETPYEMSAARGARYLLRNGLDYINYQQYERALKFFREAEIRSNELSNAEKIALQKGIEHAQRGLREAADASASYALSEQSRHRNGFNPAHPETRTASDLTQPSLIALRPKRTQSGGTSLVESDGDNQGGPIRLTSGDSASTSTSPETRVDGRSSVIKNTLAIRNHLLVKPNMPDQLGRFAFNTNKSITLDDTTPIMDQRNTLAKTLAEQTMPVTKQADTLQSGSQDASLAIGLPNQAAKELKGSLPPQLPSDLKHSTLDRASREQSDEETQPDLLKILPPLLPAVEATRALSGPDHARVAVLQTSTAKISDLYRVKSQVTAAASVSSTYLERGQAPAPALTIQSAGDNALVRERSTHASSTPSPDRNNQTISVMSTSPVTLSQFVPAGKGFADPSDVNIASKISQNSVQVNVETISAPTLAPSAMQPNNADPIAHKETEDAMPLVMSKASSDPKRTMPNRSTRQSKLTTVSDEFPPLPADLERNAMPDFGAEIAPTISPRATSLVPSPVMSDNPSPLSASLGDTMTSKSSRDTLAAPNPEIDCRTILPTPEQNRDSLSANKDSKMVSPSTVDVLQPSSTALASTVVLPSSASECQPTGRYSRSKNVALPRCFDENGLSSRPVSAQTPNPILRTEPVNETAHQAVDTAITRAPTRPAYLLVSGVPPLDAAARPRIDDEVTQSPDIVARIPMNQQPTALNLDALLPNLPKPVSTLSPELQREVETIARTQEDELRRLAQNREQPLAAQVNSVGSDLRTQTQLDISRAPSPAEARPIKAIPVPEDWVPLPPRNWSPQRKYWAAAATCHLPLYFQDPVLERYGHSVEQFVGPVGRYLTYPVDDPTQSTQRNQLLQPFFSAGLFSLQIITWPYNLIMDVPWEAQYDLGYYRPGDNIPSDTYWLPLHGYGPPLRGSRY